MTDIFDFILDGAQPEQDGDPGPLTPKIFICLKRWTDRRGTPVISADFVSDLEIDACIKQMKDELDAVGVKAKRALRRADERTAEARRI